MIPIKYFWTDFSPTESETYHAMSIAKNEECMVVVKWKAFGYTYSMIVQPDTSFNDCRKQIPKVYGL